MTALWYVLQSKPRKEEFLCSQLLAHHLEAFFPHICVHPVNPRMRKVKPYFPGYVFVYANLKQTSLFTLQWMPGARGIVAFDGEPADVPECLVSQIRQHVEQINTSGGNSIQSMATGEIVAICDGPFTGYEAIFDAHIPGTKRVRVLLKLLENRQVPLELFSKQVELIETNKNYR